MVRIAKMAAILNSSIVMGYSEVSKEICMKGAFANHLLRTGRERSSRVFPKRLVRFGICIQVSWNSPVFLLQRTSMVFHLYQLYWERSNRHINICTGNFMRTMEGKRCYGKNGK